MFFYFHNENFLFPPFFTTKDVAFVFCFDNLFSLTVKNVSCNLGKCTLLH